MPYFFTILFLASLIFLVIGLFNPSKSLFWLKANKTRKRVVAIYLLSAMLSLVGVGITAPESKTKKANNDNSKGGSTSTTEVKKDSTNDSKTSMDYSKFDYQLPESDYLFPIEINGISTKIVKDAFVHKDDQYSPEQKVNGYFLNVKFKITNPYNKIIIAPIPEYYYIGTLDNKFFSASTTRHRDCQCSIDNSTEVIDSKGKKLIDISQGRCGYNNPCVEFKPNESKEFTIKFVDPIYFDVQQLIFSGFNRRGQSPNSTREKDKVLLLDIINKKVIKEIQL